MVHSLVDNKKAGNLNGDRLFNQLDISSEL